MTHLILLLVFETQTRRSPLEPFAVVRPRLIGFELHHLYVSKRRWLCRRVWFEWGGDRKRSTKSLGGEKLPKSSQLPHTVPATACGVAPFIAGQCAPRWLRAAVGDRSNKRTHTSAVAVGADSSWPESTVTSRLSARALFWARVPRQEARYAAGASAWSSCQQHVSAYQCGLIGGAKPNGPDQWPTI